MVVPARGQSEQTAGDLARRRLLDLLGLAARAGGIVTGTDSVRRAVRDDKVFHVFLAADAAPGQQGKLTPLLEARRVPSHSLLTRDALGAAIGRDPVSAVGFTNQSFARRAAELAAALSDDRGTTEPCGDSLVE